MKRQNTFRSLLTGLALAVALACCASDDGADPGAESTKDTVATTDETTTTEDKASTEAVEEPVDGEAAIAAFCQKNDELVAVRGPVYSPPFIEPPEEVEALLAEAAVLQQELDPLVPDEIREEHDLHMAEFNAPIDALTEELGWDPFAAINTEEAAAIFASPEINAATEVLFAYLVEHCGLEAPPEG